MDFAINLDEKLALPLHKQLSEELRRAILAGRLAPGKRIPSTRALAQLLGISRTTVALSYDSLQSEGYIEAAPGAGTYICRNLPESLLRVSTVKESFSKVEQKSYLEQLSSYGRQVYQATQSADNERIDRKNSHRSTNSGKINFKNLGPALDQFPLREWGRLVSRHYRATRAGSLDYSSDYRGYQPLRAAIANYLARARAVNCQPDQIIIVNGSQQALDLIARLLIDQDDCVAVEDPGYLGARRIFLSNGARLLPLRVDERGVIPEQLTEIDDRVKFIYLTPSHQFPTGGVLPLPRRLALLDWAAQHKATIIEDDYDSQYRYSGRPIPSLQGLDRTGTVIYAGTFSKVMFPALRIGYLVVASELAELFAQAKWLNDRQTPIIEQIVLTDFINNGLLERHIRRMRTLYDRRRETLVRALQNHFKDCVTIIGESAGIHLMARFNWRLKDQEVLLRAHSVGVELIAAGQQYMKPGDYQEFIFGYANLSEYKIQEGIKRLAKVLMD